jgi:hypothetical protein
MLTSSEIMRHKFDKNIETIYTMPIDNEIVDTRVYDILNGEKPDIKESGYEEAKAFVSAELIKNKSIPFNYWREQPCPAHRDTKGDIAPCVTFRRGLHDYMMEASNGYADRQQLMQDLGFVNTGGYAASQCLRIGHMSAGEIPTCVWSVESFLKNGTYLNSLIIAINGVANVLYRYSIALETALVSGSWINHI